MGLNEVIFYATAAFAIASAAAVICSRTTVYAALYFVTHLLSVAVLYAFLNAPLIAVLQVLIYAGAVMILFIFAVMILDASVLVRVDPWRETLTWIGGGILGVILLGGLTAYLGRGNLQSSLAPAGEASMPATGENVVGIARLLFRENLFSFELTGVLLLIAVVGIMVMAKRKLES